MQQTLLTLCALLAAASAAQQPATGTGTVATGPKVAKKENCFAACFGCCMGDENHAGAVDLALNVMDLVDDVNKAKGPGGDDPIDRKEATEITKGVTEILDDLGAMGNNFNERMRADDPSAVPTKGTAQATTGAQASKAAAKTSAENTPKAKSKPKAKPKTRTAKTPSDNKNL